MLALSYCLPLTASLKNYKWAFPLALVSLATMPIGSFYTSIFAGYMVKNKVFAPSFTAFIVGLVAFWILIVAEKRGKELWGYIVPLILLGVVGAGTPSPFISIYFLAGTLGVLLVVVLLIPFFKNMLMQNAEVEEFVEESVEEAAA